MDTWEYIEDCVNDEDCKQKVQELIDNGVDITSASNRAVRLASNYGFTETVQLLLDHGADVTE